MRIALDALPEGYTAEVDGKRAVVSYGDPESPTLVSVAVNGSDLILFPDRSYKHEALAQGLGLKS